MKDIIGPRVDIWAGVNQVGRDFKFLDMFSSWKQNKISLSPNIALVKGDTNKGSVLFP